MRVSNSTVKLFMKGDKSAIAEVYNAYRNLMFFVIASYVTNKDDAEDLLSNAFIKAIEHSQELDKPSHIKNYLSKIAKNEALNFLRKDNPTPIENIDEVYGEEDQSNSLLNEIEPLLTNKELIVLYYKLVFLYTWEEITKETGIANSTARRLFSKAKEKIKEALV